VVENKPSAGGIIAADLLAKSAADGYTIMLTSEGILAINPALYQKLPYDPIGDFDPLTVAVRMPILLVTNPAQPFKNVKELLALAKAEPGKISYGSTGVGSSQHMAGELFKSMSGVDLLHVPYKGGAPALNDLLGGQIQSMFETSPTALQYVTGNKLRGLAITSTKRSPLLPNLPTVAEAGLPGYESVTWIGLVAPAGTPKAIVDRLNADLNKALAAEMGKQLAKISLDPIGGTPQSMIDVIRTDSAMYGQIIKQAGIEPQ
jgi:tripartite-type tricarboxylate transporter receptor subunit TctC